mmetsp:Transcript_10160/g.28833  ORF Transcript_10160/g.28833 Transcript_10160/m.28833 type:complete len:194 (+) Transcript_10160:146-727(+)
MAQVGEKVGEKLLARWRVVYNESREFVRTSTDVIEEHKTLLWMLGTVSSALAGWAVYTARRLHYEKIEGHMTKIHEKISGIEKAEREQEQFLGRQATLGLTPLNMVLVLGPAVLSSFMVGYLAGRTQGSYKHHRQLEVIAGLSKNRVYIAAIPERMFESGTAARELEKAVVEANASRANDVWWLKRLRRRPQP